MNIIVFASPGIMGPYVFFGLAERKKEKIQYLVLPLTKHSISSDELIAVAAHAHVPYLAPKSLTDAAFIEQLRNAKPDLIIVSSYDTKIPPAIRTIPKYGAVNLHPSLLPKYRGACPEFWAIRNGDGETGVTLHYLSDTFDSGDIIAQERIPLDLCETLGSLLYKVGRTSLELIGSFLDMLHENKPVARRRQDDANATKAPLVGQNDLRINWHESATAICNLIRAGNPLGGAWTLFRGYQLKIWYAVPLAYDDYVNAETARNTAPGTLHVDTINNRILVTTGEGLVHITAVQYALFFIMDGWNFALQAHTKSGESIE